MRSFITLYVSLYIIRVIKSRSMLLGGHVARMGEIRNAYNISVGKPREKRPLGRLGIYGTIIL